MTQDRSLRILLVEDNPGDARYIRELLGEATGLSERELLVEPSGPSGDGTPEVLHERRLEAGLQRLDETDVDLVLLDLNLPDSRGLETLSALRQRTETVPVVVLTGLSDRQVGRRALRQGAEEYLVKDEINAELLIRSVYHAIERLEHERELKRYETLIEESTDVNAILDADGTFQYVTPSARRVLDYDPGELIGEDSLEYVHPDDRDEIRAEYAALTADPDYRPTLEFRFEHADGSWVVLRARVRNLLEDPMIDGLVVYTHDITERKEYERRLARQREQLAALNQLNEVVQEITDAVIDQSTREEIESAVCEHLARVDSYRFAWIGEVDSATNTIAVRAAAGTDGYLDDASISIDPDDERGGGPTGKAFRTQTIQTVQNVQTDPRYEPWRELAAEYGFRSSAAIPIVHGEVLYGVLNVYAERPGAFTDEEGAVVGQLGEIVGHAIAAVERKRALTSDELVEVEIHIREYLESIGASETDVRILIEQAIPIDDEGYILYGESTEEGISTLESLVDRHDEWTDLAVRGDSATGSRFEVRLSESPVLAAVIARGGRIARAVIEDGEYRLTVHLPQESDVRRLAEAIQETYPTAEPLARRQISRSSDPARRFRQAWEEELTERQQTALEVAYLSGFFEWPRDKSGAEIAESMDISPATFTQHLRAAENKLLGALLEEALKE